MTDSEEGNRRSGRGGRIREGGRREGGVEGRGEENKFLNFALCWYWTGRTTRQYDNGLMTPLRNK